MLNSSTSSLVSLSNSLMYLCLSLSCLLLTCRSVSAIITTNALTLINNPPSPSLRTSHYASPTSSSCRSVALRVYRGNNDDYANHQQQEQQQYQSFGHDDNVDEGYGNSQSQHQHQHQDQQDGGNGNGNLFDSMGNLFHQLFPKNTIKNNNNALLDNINMNMPSIDIPDVLSSLHIPERMSDIIPKNIPDMMPNINSNNNNMPVPDMFTQPTTEQNQNEMYQVEEVRNQNFDTNNIPEDTEEALAMAMANELANARGLGDMKVPTRTKSVSVRTPSESSSFFRENNNAFYSQNGRGNSNNRGVKKQKGNNNNANREAGAGAGTGTNHGTNGSYLNALLTEQGKHQHVVRGSEVLNKKPSLFQQANAAVAAANLKKNRASEGRQIMRGSEVLEKKPSMFQQANNAAVAAAAALKKNRALEGRQIMRGSEVLEKKPSMFQQANSAGALKKNRASEGRQVMRGSEVLNTKPSMFQQTNSAAALKKNHASEGRQVMRGSEVLNTKPSMFQQTNSAAMSDLVNGRRPTNQEEIIRVRSNNGLKNDVSLFEATNAAALAGERRRSDNKNYNALQMMGEGRYTANAADIKHQLDGNNAGRVHQLPKSSSPRGSSSYADAYVDAATAAAKAAWEKASELYSSNIIVRQSPASPQDGAMAGEYRGGLSNTRRPSLPTDDASVHRDRRNQSFAKSGGDVGVGTGMGDNSGNGEDRDSAVDDYIQGYYRPDPYATSENNDVEKYDEYDNEIQNEYLHEQNGRRIYSNAVPQSSSTHARARDNPNDVQEGYYNDYKHSLEGGNDSMDNDQERYLRKIIITDSALELAQSLTLDIYEIIRYKKHENGFDFGGVDDDDDGADRFIVNEDDVRDYLDKRYENLVSRLSMDNEMRKSAPNPMRRSENSANYDQGRNVDNVYGMHNSRTTPDFVEEDWEAFHDPHEANDDTYGWSKSQFSQYAPKTTPQTPRRLLQQQQQPQGIEAFDSYQSNNPQSRGSKDSLYGQRSYDSQRGDDSAYDQNMPTHRQMQPIGRSTDDVMRGHQNPPPSLPFISEVPLSQLISNPKDDKMERLAQSTSGPFPHSGQMSQANSRQPYQHQQQQRNAVHHGPTHSDRPSLNEQGGSAAQDQLAFQEMSQSRFPESYQGRADQTIYHRMPTHQSSEGELTA